MYGASAVIFLSENPIFQKKITFLHMTVPIRQYCTRFEYATQNHMELIVPQLVKQYGVTEQLKADNQMADERLQGTGRSYREI